MAHHYISYDQTDGLEIARKLSYSLEKGLPKLSTWIVDQHVIGDDSAEEALNAIQTCDCFIALLTPNSNNENSRCKIELKKAIRYRKPICVVIGSTAATLIPRLENRITFTFKDSNNEIRLFLQQFDSYRGRKRTLEEYLDDIKNDLVYRENNETSDRLKREAESLRNEIDNLNKLIINKAEVINETKTRINLGIEREKRPDRNYAAIPTFKIINCPPSSVPSFFQDRIVETDLAAQFLKEESTKIVTIIGRGGVGKTAMTCRLLKHLEHGRLPNGNTAFDIGGIIYMNEIGSRPITFHNLFNDFLLLLNQDERNEIDSLQDNSQSTVESKLRKLIQLLPKKPIIVLLDNFEDKLEKESSKIIETELKDALVYLINAHDHSIKFVLTTRIRPVDFNFMLPNGIREINLSEGLDSPYAENLLKELDADGSAGIKSASDETLKKIKDFTRGFPRAIEAFYSILSVGIDTSVNELIETNVSTERVTQVLIGEAFNLLSDIEKKIMQGLAIYSFPVRPNAIDYLLRIFIPTIDSTKHLLRLYKMHFVRKEGGEFYLHPLDREYALARIPKKIELTDQYNFSFLELKRIAAEYIHKISLPRSEWRTLDDIIPQYREFNLLMDSKDYFSASHVLKQLQQFLDKTGGFTMLLMMAESLEKASDDKATKIMALEALSSANWRKGDLELAVSYQKKLVSLASENGEEVPIWIRGNLLIYQRDLVSSEESLSGFLDLLEEEYMPRNKATIHHNIAWSYKTLGYFDKAIYHAKEALMLQEDFGDVDGIEAQNHNYGTSVYQVNRQEALIYYNKALELSEQSSNPLWKANHLSSIASFYFDEGEIDKAIELQRQALEIKINISDLGGEADEMRNLSYFLFCKGNEEEAEKLSKKALDKAKDLRLNLSSYLTKLAKILIFRKRYSEALDYLSKAINNTKELDYEEYNLSGICYFLLNNSDNAISQFQIAKKNSEVYISRYLKNRSALAHNALACFGLSLLSIASKKNKEQAITNYKSSRDIDNGKGILIERKKLYKLLDQKIRFKDVFEAICEEEKENSPIVINSTKPLKAFISYSKIDGESNTDGVNYLEDFKKHLAPLSRFDKLITTWDDTQLMAGEDWDASIKENLDSSDIVFLLVSSDFLTTRYIIDEEIAIAMKRHGDKECLIIPIIIRKCGFTDIEMFKKLNAIPRKGKTIQSWKSNKDWNSMDDAWNHIYEEVKKLIRQFRAV
jgi:tetratricopeptide (TPR) repeat protein